MNQYMEETNDGLVHTYNRFPVVLDHGEGGYLYDTDGKKYLDFAAGIAVSGLGYSNEAVSYTHLSLILFCLFQCKTYYTPQFINMQDKIVKKFKICKICKRYV